MPHDRFDAYNSEGWRPKVAAVHEGRMPSASVASPKRDDPVDDPSRRVGLILVLCALTIGPALTAFAAWWAYRTAPPPPPAGCDDPSVYFGCLFEQTPAEQAYSSTFAALGALDAVVLIAGFVHLVSKWRSAGQRPDDWPAVDDALLAFVTLGVIGLVILAVTLVATGTFIAAGILLALALNAAFMALAVRLFALRRRRRHVR